MILSKNSLKVVDIALVDKGIPVLNNVHITSDGTTIAANGKSVIAVSPVNDDVKSKVPLNESEYKKSSTISTDTIKEVVKNIPRDTMFKGLLEYCDLNDGTFTVTDGQRKRKIESKLYRRAFINFAKIFRMMYIKRKVHKIAVNRKRLIKLLQVMDSICPDTSGESAVYIDFSYDGGMLLRGLNHKNGQRCIGIMNSYKGVDDNWLEPNSWEKKLCQKKIAIKKNKI